MGNTENSIVHIEDSIDNLGQGQLGVEAVADPVLGFKMWGGKDFTGFVTRWLAKGKPGLLSTLQLSGNSTIGKIGFVKHDENGNLTGGHEPGAGDRLIEKYTAADTTNPADGEITIHLGTNSAIYRISKKNIYGETTDLIANLGAGARCIAYINGTPANFINGKALTNITTVNSWWEVEVNFVELSGSIPAGSEIIFDYQNPPADVAPGTETAKSIVFSVINGTGAALSALTPVQVATDADLDGIPTAIYCQANSKNTCTNLVILLEDVAIGGTALAIRAGLHTGLDTSALTADQVYYVSATAASTLVTKPASYPNLSCRVFKCLSKDATEGSIDVMIDADPQYQTGTVSVTQQIETFSIAVAGSEIDPAIIQYTLYGSMVLPALNMIVTTASKLRAYVRQYAAGDIYLCVYKLESDLSITRLFYTAANTMPASYTGFITYTVDNIDTQFGADDILYFCLFGNTNGIRMAGSTGVTFNEAPYATIKKDNITATVPPATIAAGAYNSAANAIYIELNATS